MSTRPPVPASLEDLDPAWLCAALALPADAIRSVTVGPAAGGIAVTGRVAQLRLERGPGSAAPSSLFAKVVNPDWTDSRELYEREVRFYQELAAHHDLPVPRCLYADLNPDDQGFVLLLEDLTDAVPGHRLAGLDAREAALVLRALAQVHAAWWQSPVLRELDWPVKTYTQRYAEELQDCFMGRWPKVRDDPRYDLPVKAQSAARHLPDCIVGDLLDLSSGPRTLIHSDLHSENLLLDGDRVVLLDWQNAALGHPALDVASVLCGTVSVAAQQALGRELLAVYEDALAEHGVTTWSEEALEAGIGSATRWLFSGVCCWLASYEAESPRDVETAGGHLERLAAGLVLWG